MRAIEHFEIGAGRDGVGLRRAHVAVEDQGLDVELDGAHHDLLQLAGAEQELRVDAVAQLDHLVRDGDARRLRQVGELVEACARGGERAAPLLVADVDQDGQAVLGARRAVAELAREFGFEIGD